MSYVRWGEEGSDVYIYDSVDLGLICFVCDLEGSVAGEDFDVMLKHIALHRSLGDHVPESVDKELIDDRDGKGWRSKFRDQG